MRTIDSSNYVRGKKRNANRHCRWGQVSGELGVAEDCLEDELPPVPDPGLPVVPAPRIAIEGGGSVYVESAFKTVFYGEKLAKSGGRCRRVVNVAKPGAGVLAEMEETGEEDAESQHLVISGINVVLVAVHTSEFATLAVVIPRYFKNASGAALDSIALSCLHEDSLMIIADILKLTHVVPDSNDGEDSGVLEWVPGSYLGVIELAGLATDQFKPVRRGAPQIRERRLRLRAVRQRARACTRVSLVGTLV